MRFAVRDHQNKSVPFSKALSEHTLVRLGEWAELFLIDLDLPHPLYRSLIDRYSRWDAKVIVYPHGAMPTLNYDGLSEPDPRVDVQIVPAPGHVEVMRAYGLERRLEVCGFPWPQLPFCYYLGEPRILFAPHHPCGSGWLGETERRQNAEVFAALLEIPGEKVVRHVGTLAQNGLEYVEGVEYIQGDLSLTWADIDRADAVVSAYGTFSYMAVARGTPTAVYGQDIRPYEGEGTPSYVRNWELYRDIYRYPWDIADLGLEGALDASRTEATEWREKFIGAPFDPAKFCAIAEEVLCPS